MGYTVKQIESKTTELLLKFNGNSLPVNLEKIAERLKLNIVTQDLGENVSGALYISNGTGTIGVNPKDGEVRKRFTIAHEIGHYVLHRLSDELFVDTTGSYKPIYRDEKSSKGEIRKEREANAFAAALLMPAHLVRAKVKRAKLDLGDDDAFTELAKDFGVSLQAMSYRLANLNIF